MKFIVIIRNEKVTYEEKVSRFQQCPNKIIDQIIELQILKFPNFPNLLDIVTLQFKWKKEKILQET